MAEEIEKSMNKPSLLIKLKSEERTWDFVSILFWVFLLCSSLNFVRNVFFRADSLTLAEFAEEPALYASAAVLVFVLLAVVALDVASMLRALAVAVPTLVVAWISVLVLLTFFGKSRIALVFERGKITADFPGFAIQIYLGDVLLLLQFVFLLREEDEEEETSNSYLLTEFFQLSRKEVYSTEKVEAPRQKLWLMHGGPC
ncbi:hypothetical protein MKW98_008381 [Papaver atlanticum]|uniref:Transmembrane protein n=1 Tax=Papaver atlanticum TaxID=357466 RepID=A0AAD4SCT7_9MAGN|nr:hypothetical protein MKW98_008381 [Papaver atlanticum]